MSRISTILKASALILPLMSYDSFAKSAADALLNQVGGETNQEQDVVDQKKNQELNAFANFKIDDGFLMVFFAEWRAQNGLSYEQNMWAMKILQHKFDEAAHLWSTIDKTFSESFRPTAEVAQTYLVYRLGLNQTFVNLAIENARKDTVRNSKAFMALDQLVSANLAKTIMDQGINLRPDQVVVLSQLTDSKLGLVLTLKNWANIRNGEYAVENIKTLPVSHPFIIPMAKTAVLQLARQNKLGEAGKILKNVFEKEVSKSTDMNLAADYYLLLGRLLYQAGALDAAEDFYKKIPNSLPQFYTARTELTWVYLRKGDIGKLRGELVSLSSPIFEDRFLPEVYLVRSISNLKLCHYDMVAKDFEAFIKNNSKWSKEIDSALKEANKNEGLTDYYYQLAKLASESRVKEIAVLEDLGQKSIKAALPAVGVQSHWTNYVNNLKSNDEEAKKQMASEGNRFWKNRMLVLEEAINKMRFVKVEAISQIKSSASLAMKGGVGDTVSQVSSGSSKDSEMNFKFDGVFWPDELFHLQSVAQNNCMATRKP